jgi:hypothetical protein
MIQITLKAKHYYYIVRFLKNYSLEQYFSLFSRIATALNGNTDDEAEFSVTASVEEIVAIYKILTILPEGQANSINVEMAAMLQTEIQNGVAVEIGSGIQNGDWQMLGAALTQIRTENTLARLADIQTGKNLLTNE